jgi:biopolymer transport protein ExbD
MNFRRKAKARGEIFINLTSMIDVVLNLIIFFLLSSSFVHPSSLKVDLPRSAAGENLKPGEEVVVVVTKENEIMMDGQPYTAGTLLEKLTEIRESNSGKTITIQADENSTHGAVVSAMDAAKRAGFEKLSIATVKEK